MSDFSGFHTEVCPKCGGPAKLKHVKNAVFSFEGEISESVDVIICDVCGEVKSE